jgi:LAO/AO transport system ATPase
MLESLLEGFQHGDRLALSRLLTYASQGKALPEILSHLKSPPKSSQVIAFTGSAGVGKSSLIGKLIELLRRDNRRVAVLACDPQSPLSGGALLGDRFRMPTQVEDDVFIRSLAATPGHGAVAEHLPPMIRLLESFGFDTIFIETVGAGQSDTAVASLADVVAVILQPEAGDDLQWEKAGLLEVADIVVINKGDLPKADHVESQVRTILGLSEGRHVPIVRTSAKSGEGIDGLWAAIQAMPRKNRGGGDGRELLLYTQELLAEWFMKAQAKNRPDVLQLIKNWQEFTNQRDVIVRKLIQLVEKDISAAGGLDRSD